MRIKSLIIIVALALAIILGPGLSHAQIVQSVAQSNAAIRSSKQLLNEERQQNSQLLIDVWGNPMCYQTLGTVPVSNPYNKDGSTAQVSKARLWSNDPENRCVNGQAPQATASIVFVQLDLSSFARKVRERLDITVRMFNQSGLILADLDTVLGVPIPPDEAVDQISALSEYHKKYGKEKHRWNTGERLFYHPGLNRQSENGSGDDIVPSVQIGKGPCKTMITSVGSCRIIYDLGIIP